ncbi:MAG: ATPase, T2SS/T4P/T4SS family [Myxococcales bacterium]|nr:ATPase, T2SS/T4P/T4SS family [Myxococcales bacterium]MDH3486094.1 ATPase, T2SS/T4P/T4SS family [Myxococcales bacterium]
MTPTAIAEFLGRSSLFHGCPPEVAQKVAPHIEAIEAPSGTALVRAGSHEHDIGILMHGKASVSMLDSASGSRTTLFTIGVGDHFGELGTLLHEPQPYDVVAESPCVVLTLRGSAVEQLCRKIPAFAQALAESLADRLVKTSTSRPPPPPSSAVHPVTSDRPSVLTRAGETIPFVRVSSYELMDAVIETVPVQIIQQHRMIPLDLRDRVLTIGMVDPFNEAALRDLRRVLHNAEPKVVAISTEDFIAATRRFKLHGFAHRARRGQRLDPNSVVFDETDSKRDSERSLQSAGEQIVALASEVVATGLERGASDIHLEPEREGVRVRFRVNGMLLDWEQTVQAHLAKALIARFKVLAGLDIAEKRRPQDGRIGVRVGRRDVDLRVSTLPASEGEKLVMRVFEAAAMLRPLEQIFVEEGTLSAMRDVLQRPYGAIVVAGPTGSGKTSTLYAALHERQKIRPDTNIITVEDPIEYRLDGVTQVQVHHAIGLGFAQVLRAMLRQDPDVVMVGEVRDEETAQLALEAAMTGHLVFTSIHANNAGAVIQRFENFGCNRTVIAHSMALVLIQRLARRLCPRCTVTGDVPELLRDSLIARKLYDPASPVPLPRAPGCDACDQTGLLGRVAVIESMRLTDEIRSMLMANRPLGDAIALAEQTGALVQFPRYASFMMGQRLIGPAEALLSVAS